jgi:hypothetical protein
MHAAQGIGTSPCDIWGIVWHQTYQAARGTRCCIGRRRDVARELGFPLVEMRFFRCRLALRVLECSSAHFNMQFNSALWPHLQRLLSATTSSEVGGPGGSVWRNG